MTQKGRFQWSPLQTITHGGTAKKVSTTRTRTLHFSFTTTPPFNNQKKSTKKYFYPLAIFLPGEAGAVAYRYCIYSGGKFDRWEGGGELFRELEPYKNDKLLQETEDKFGTKTFVNELVVHSMAKNSKKVFTSAEGR
jgi:hypothetical protein